MSFKCKSLSQNLCSFLQSRPPLVLFSLCLATMAAVTMSFALYFRYDGSIKNPDVMGPNSIGRSLRKLRFCLVPDSSALNISINMLAQDRTFLRFETKDTPEILHHHATYWTQINAQDLGFQTAANISATFVPERSSNPSICAVFYHPSVVKYPETSEPHCKPSVLSDNATAKHFLLKLPDPSEHRLVPSYCNATNIFSFNVKHNEAWDVMLTEEDKAIIHSHLMATSLLLFAVFLSILCFGLLRGAPRTSNLTFEKLQDDIDQEPLTS